MHTRQTRVRTPSSACLPLSHKHACRPARLRPQLQTGASGTPLCPELHDFRPQLMSSMVSRSSGHVRYGGGAMFVPLAAGVLLAASCAAEEVATPAAFNSSVYAGVEHIAVVGHLDLSDFDAPFTNEAGTQKWFFFIRPTTSSIRGNCTSKYKGELDLFIPMQPRQCHILLPWGVNLNVYTMVAVWLDNLYLEDAPKPDNYSSLFAAGRRPSLMLQVYQGGLVWLTYLTMQGDLDLSAALQVNAAPPGFKYTSGRAYVYKVIVAHFSTPDGNVGPVYNEGYLTIQNCTIQENIFLQFNTGLIETRTPDDKQDFAVTDLINVAFVNNAPNNMLMKSYDRALVASDNPTHRLEWRNDDGEILPAPEFDVIPKSQRRFMLDGRHPKFRASAVATGGFRDLDEVSTPPSSPPLPPSSPPLPPSSPPLPPPLQDREGVADTNASCVGGSESCNGNDAMSGGQTDWILVSGLAGASFGAVVFIATLAAMVVYARRRQVRVTTTLFGQTWCNQPHREIFAEDETPKTGPPMHVADETMAPPTVLMLSTIPTQSTETAPLQTASIRSGGPTLGPDMEAYIVSAASPRSRTAAALDWMHDQSLPLFGRFVLGGTGNTHRRRGGQALVQFVVDKKSMEQFAVKFFMRERDYQRERQLYDVPALRMSMPNVVFAADAGSGPQMPDGVILSACLVMDRGESMEEFVAAAGHDLFTTVQALGHVAKRLSTLHELGWVHRDLKPGNLLWNPLMRSWCLLDLGCAAQNGKLAGIAYSLPYASPEVLEAVEGQKKQVMVTTAMDMWAFGIIALEMLIEQPIFPVETSKQNIFDAVLGRAPLLWENDNRSSQVLGRLGVFKKTILACLHRDPQKRIGCKELYQRWTKIFVSTKRTTTTEPEV